MSDFHVELQDRFLRLSPFEQRKVLGKSCACGKAPDVRCKLCDVKKRGAR